MINPFSKQNAGEAHLKRNAYPLSYQNLFTTEYGRVTPIYVQDVIPGDSIQISGAVAIQGMPTVFPLQTRVRASLSFFLCRNRCVHDEFEDYIFQTKDIESPWLKLNNSRAKKMISTGSLGDFFNISTTKGGSSSVSKSIEFRYLGSGGLRPYQSAVSFTNILSTYFSPGSSATGSFYNDGNISSFYQYYVNVTSIIDSSFLIKFNSSTTETLAHSVIDRFALVIVNPNNDNVIFYEKFNMSSSIGSTYITQSLPFSDDFIEKFNQCISDFGSVDVHLIYSNINVSGVLNNTLVKIDNTTYTFATNVFSATSIVPVSYSVVLSSKVLDATDDSVISSNIYVGDNPIDRLDAYKFRHYEQVCNYYYRDDRNNPYYINGEVQYNKFCPSTASGADTNVYDFHYAPWEKDFYTTAVQSPQFGDAPLVGLTVNSDGETADLIFNVGDKEGVSVDGTSEADKPKIRVHIDEDGYIDAIGDFDARIPSANLRKLINGMQSKTGISINDLRVTNSFQRFLENTLRRGLRYRNQLKSHFGVSVDYPDIDIPQYIGGVSGELQVSKITNTADSPNAGLGDFVGQLSGIISMRHKITCYCPEHGFIMGMLTISPIPTYPQVTSRNNLRSHPFDYYLPEFAKIGYVPIHYSELCPLQNSGSESPHDIFGYQRAHYDYMQRLDEVHGDFRTSLRDFVLTRTFAERPTLVEDFVRVKPDQLNDVFVSNNIADEHGSTAKFMCNAMFTVSGKRPISMPGTPSLE